MIKDAIRLLVQARPIGSGSVAGYRNILRTAKRVSIKRGKDSAFSNFVSGTLSVTFNNHDRTAEPNSPDPSISLPSPYVEYRHEIYLAHTRESETNQNFFTRVGAGAVNDPSNSMTEYVMFGGVTEQWDYTYDIEGNSIAQMVAYDPLRLANERELIFGNGLTTDVTRIYQFYNPGFPFGNYFAPTFLAGDQVLPFADDAYPNTKAAYDALATSTQSLIFASRYGQPWLIPRLFPSEYVYSVSGKTFDARPIHNFGENGIQFFELDVDYSTDLIYNKIVLTNTLDTTVTIEDTESQDFYGVKKLELNDLLTPDNELQDFAVFLANKYSRKKFRIRSISINLTKYDQDQWLSPTQVQLLGAEIGDHCIIEHTPNGIGDPLEFIVQIIGIEHDITPDNYIVKFTLDEKRHDTFILNDEIFGKLDTNQLG